MIPSPITGKKATLLFHIPTDLIRQKYKSEYNIETGDYFTQLDEIGVYECPDTQYRFFYPFNIAGDERLYEALEKYEGYYSEWKWDYEVATPFIKNGDTVLDVGCGNGRFVEYLANKKKCTAVGLELNENSVAAGKAKGIDIRCETIQQHAMAHKEMYNVVCLFQVLEHISDINSFLTAAISCIKPGGKLIICVPNNDPYYLHFEKYNTLNLPPHHMGWWNAHSLSALAGVYHLKLHKVQKEPIENLFHFTNIFIRAKAGNNEMKKNIMKLSKPFLWAYFAAKKNSAFFGRHIMVVHTK